MYSVTLCIAASNRSCLATISRHKPEPQYSVPLLPSELSVVGLWTYNNYNLSQFDWSLALTWIPRTWLYKRIKRVFKILNRKKQYLIGKNRHFCIRDDQAHCHIRLKMEAWRYSKFARVYYVWLRCLAMRNDGLIPIRNAYIIAKM